MSISDDDSKPIDTVPRPKHSHPTGKLKVASLNDLDARTRVGRIARDLIREMEIDLGGDLTSAKRQLVQRAVMMGVMAEDMEARWLSGEAVDPTVIATLGNAQRRLLADLGLERQARDVTDALESHLEKHYSDEAIAQTNDEAGIK